MSAYRDIVVHRSAALFVKHILRKVFLEDWALKLIALFITLALWYGVSLSSKKGTATLEAQLSIRPSDDAVVMNVGRQKVSMSVSGDDRLIGDLYGRSDLRVTADLTHIPPGEHIVQLTPQTVSTNLPPGIKLEDIQPSGIDVTLEPLIQKELPVEAKITGEPMAGYEVYSTTITPARVGVRGPKSFVETLNSVPTGTVDISRTKSDVTRQVVISIDNPKVTVLPYTVVDVTVEIGERRIERSFVLSAAGKRVIAVVYGPRSLITKLKPGELKVDIIKTQADQESATLTLPPPLQGSAEVRSVKIQ